MYLSTVSYVKAALSIVFTFVLFLIFCFMIYNLKKATFENILVPKKSHCSKFDKSYRNDMEYYHMEALFDYKDIEKSI